MGLSQHGKEPEQFRVVPDWAVTCGCNPGRTAPKRPGGGKSAPHAPAMGSRARRSPERSSGKSVLGVRSTQLCVPCRNFTLECPQPLWSLHRAVSPVPLSAQTSPHHPANRRAGNYLPCNIPWGMDNFIHWWWQWCLSCGNSCLMSLIPSLTPAQHGRHLLSFSLARKNQGVTSISMKNQLTGLPRG